MTRAALAVHRRRMLKLAGGVVAGIIGLGAVGEIIGRTSDGGVETVVSTPYVVFANNDLGMHCMGQDFSELMVLPPFNTVHAQVIRRGIEPQIVSSGVTVSYVLPSNTHGADKTNFWEYAQALLGVALPPDVGLTGHGMKGTFTSTPNQDWEVTGIPLVPIDDDGRENPYPMATVTVKQGSTIVGQTQTVVPVSWEMSCFLCHVGEPGETFGMDILKDHDRLHATSLATQTPVFCGSCHADNALGTPGTPGVPNLSSAMHLAHADRMSAIQLDVDCYACHPGERTKCQRDVHFIAGMTCHSCHGDMNAVGDPTRNPWVDEPSCAGCHQRQGFEFEEPGKLFRQSRGHRGVTCLACHGSPHAIAPTSTEVDNIQATTIQGHAGTINNCTVCHTPTPHDPFPHRFSDD